MVLIYMKIDFETMLQNDIPTFNMFVRVFIEKNFSFEFHSVFIYNYEADFLGWLLFRNLKVYLGYQFSTKMHWVDPLASTDLCSIWKQEFMVWSLSANLRLSAVTLKDHWKIQVKWLQGRVKNITQLA